MVSSMFAKALDTSAGTSLHKISKRCNFRNDDNDMERALSRLMASYMKLPSGN